MVDDNCVIYEYNSAVNFSFSVRVRRLSQVALVLAVAASATGLAQTSPIAPWSYDLRPGDHLVYAEAVERTGSGTVEFHSLAHFTSQVVVVAAAGGSAVVGVQRGRDGAKLLAYRENGKDKLDEQRRSFEAQLARQSPFVVEANRLDRRGAPAGRWSAYRETASRLALAIHEIEPLPSVAVGPGSAWSDGDLKFRYVGEVRRDGSACASLEGRSSSGFVLRYVYCPAQQTMAELEIEGSYATFSGMVHDKISFRLQQRTRGETVAAWLANAATRGAVLQAALSSPEVPVSSQDVLSATSVPPDLQVLGLSLLYRRAIGVPADRLAAFSSIDERVGRLVSLLKSGARAGADAGPPPGATLRTVQTGAQAGAAYILHVPENFRRGDSLPVVVYLAGGSGIATDALNSGEPVLSRLGVFAVYPHAAGKMWWEGPAAAQVDAIVDEVTREFGLGGSPVFLAGFSNGATGAMVYASLWPRRFAGIVSLMGAGGCLSREQGWKPEALKGIPVLLVHGDDDPIISPTCSEKAAKDLQRAGAVVEYHRLRKRGHDITLGSDEGYSVMFLQRLLEER